LLAGPQFYPNTGHTPNQISPLSWMASWTSWSPISPLGHPHSTPKVTLPYIHHSHSFGFISSGLVLEKSYSKPDKPSLVDGVLDFMVADHRHLGILHGTDVNHSWGTMLYTHGTDCWDFPFPVGPNLPYSHLNVESLARFNKADIGMD
jgi:hypothetical protein